MGPQMAPKWSLNALRGGLAIIILKIFDFEASWVPILDDFGALRPLKIKHFH